MGCGNSRGAVVVSQAGANMNAESNNNIHGDEGLKQRGKFDLTAGSHDDENMADLPTSDRFNVKTVANLTAVNSLKEKEFVEKPTDQNSILRDADSELLLSSFSTKNPAMAAVMRDTLSYFEALKKALHSGTLYSPATFNLVKGLFNVYFVDKTLKNRTGLTEFAVALGVPTLANKIIVNCRGENQGLTTWDREKVNELVNGEERSNEQNHKDDKDRDNTDSLKLAQDVISQILAAVLNFSDLNDNFCLACDEAGMVKILIKISQELQDSVSHHVKYMNPETQQLSKYTVRGKMLSRALGILHNLSKRVPTRRSFAACQAIDMLIPLLKAEVTLFSAKSLLVLAYLTDEENNHLIMADEGPIKFLTSLLQRALRKSGHRYVGFSASELAEGLNQIAVNDNNKKTIARSGAIPVLVSMLQKAEDDIERLNACNTLWTLAFDEENRNEINGIESAIAELRKLLTSKNNELKKAAGGALWECEGKKKHAEEKQLSISAPEVTDSKHVMISYQWDVQKSMIQLKTQLQAQGYKVWMDIDEMGGSTLESMARAVENASVVLVCVSQKYKESPNCRSEAEYTYQLHKDIIPLMMDYKYKPDGWLGIIVGTKFWIDFTERHKVDSNVEKLVKELGSRGKIVLGETIQATTLDLLDAKPQRSISSWTHDDVISWLKEKGLENRLDPKAVQRLNGRMLLRLQDLRKESPEFFYSSIKSEFKLTSVFDVVDFVDALANLER